MYCNKPIKQTNTIYATLCLFPAQEEIIMTPTEEITNRPTSNPNNGGDDLANSNDHANASQASETDASHLDTTNNAGPSFDNISNILNITSHPDDGKINTVQHRANETLTIRSATTLIWKDSKRYRLGDDFSSHRQKVIELLNRYVGATPAQQGRYFLDSLNEEARNLAFSYKHGPNPTLEQVLAQCNQAFKPDGNSSNLDDYGYWRLMMTGGGMSQLPEESAKSYLARIQGVLVKYQGTNPPKEDMMRLVDDARFTIMGRSQPHLKAKLHDEAANYRAEVKKAEIEGTPLPENNLFDVLHQYILNRYREETISSTQQLHQKRKREDSDIVPNKKPTLCRYDGHCTRKACMYKHQKQGRQGNGSPATKPDSIKLHCSHPKCSKMTNHADENCWRQHPEKRPKTKPQS